MKWLLVILAVIVAVVGLSVGLGSRKEAALNVVGSTSIQPFAEMLAQEFDKANPDCRVDVQGGGSTQGLRAVETGMADIGMCSRALKKEEAEDPAKNFRPIVIARDGLAIVVHPSNPIKNLTRKQIERLFAGDVADWKDVGGDDRPVRLITREEGSGTREAFTKLVMGKARISRGALTQESNGAVKELVRNDPAAIGYMSLGLVHGELKIVKVDGILPTAEEVTAGRYPLVRPFLFITPGEPTPCARRFIDYVLSPTGQRMLEHEGLVAAK